MGRKTKDLTGQRFYRLVVIREIKQTETEIILSRGHAHWLCKCDCGNEVIVRSDRLTTSGTKSCGCLITELASERMRKTNNKRSKMGVGHGL